MLRFYFQRISRMSRLHYAHSTNDESRANWQPLLDHLIGTADRAAKFGQLIGLAKAAKLAGLLHDLGKYGPEFQARLNGAAELRRSLLPQAAPYFENDPWTASIQSDGWSAFAI